MARRDPVVRAGGAAPKPPGGNPSPLVPRASCLVPSVTMKLIRKTQLQRIRRRFVRLYGEERAGLLVERFASMIGRYGVGLDTAHNPERWDENDVVLITYADMVHDVGERPLQTLRRFCTRRLKHLVSTVHILPFSPWSSDDGFSVINYREVAAGYGKWDDVSSLRPDFDLMFDLVLNHCSRESLWFRDFVTGIAPARYYFITQDPRTDLSLVTRPRPWPLLNKTATRDGHAWVWCTFSADQVDLNWENPDVLFEFLDILFLYLSKGARILRLDAVAFLWKTLGTTCVHLPETHEVVKLFRDVLEVVSPQTLLLTETNVPHDENVSYFGKGDEAHMVYNFSLPPLLLHALLRGDSTQLTRWSQAQKNPQRGTTYLNFTASHDGIGVRPLQGILDDEIPWLVDEVRRRGGRVNMRAMPDGSERPYELNITYMSALSFPDTLGDDLAGEARFLCSQAVALSFQGIPAIYFHSLVGTKNWLEGLQKEGAENRTINRRKWAREEIEALIDDETSHHHRVFTRYGQMLRRRRDHPAFHPAAPMKTYDLGPQFFAFMRTSLDGSERILCVFNFTAEDQKVPLSTFEELGLSESGTVRDVLSASTLKTGRNRNLTFGPYQAAWLLIRERG